MSEAAVSRAGGKGRIGPTLRAVLVAPEAGFGAAIKSTLRREQSGRRPGEGYAPSVIGALGFGALCLLWLKLASLLHLREVAAADFRWDFLIASFFLAAALGLALQHLWGALSGPLLRSMASDTSAPSGSGRPPARPQASAAVFRSVWGLALFPQMLALAILLPLDLLIVGPETFTSERLADPLAKLWAAISIAGGTFLAAWSLWLLYKGIGVALTAPRGRSVLLGTTAVGLSIGTVVVLVLISRTVSGVTG
ncbi:MAG: hypothetical protein ABR505_01745 [Actinomycetota bacterium]